MREADAQSLIHRFVPHQGLYGPSLRSRSVFSPQFDIAMKDIEAEKRWYGAGLHGHYTVCGGSAPTAGSVLLQGHLSFVA